MIGILFLSLFSCAVARFGMWMLVGVKLGTQVVWNLKLYFSEEHPLTLFVCISNEWRHSTNLVRAKTWTSACGKLSGEAASLCELGYSGKVPKICIYTGFWQWCNVCLLFKPFLWGKWCLVLLPQSNQTVGLSVHLPDGLHHCLVWPLKL